MAAGAALLSACVTTRVEGAEIRPSAAGDLVLEGPIVAGDYEKLRSALLDPYSSNSDLFLASPGGDLAEAMKIGRLVRRMKISTTVPTVEERSNIRDKIIARHNLRDSQNYVCASACFFIFVAGIHRETVFIGPPNLSIHRPFLSRDDLIRLSSDQAIDAVTGSRKAIEAYLSQMSVPLKYADRMFSVPPDQAYRVTEEEFDADFDGFITELKDWVDAQCDKRTDEEKQIYKQFKDRSPMQMPFAAQATMKEIERKYEHQLKCEMGLRERLALSGYRAELSR
ncbi:hypothetical protein [Bradyrhizobium sp. USDA 4503]